MTRPHIFLPHVLRSPLITPCRLGNPPHRQSQCQRAWAGVRRETVGPRIAPPAFPVPFPDVRALMLVEIRPTLHLFTSCARRRLPGFLLAGT